MSNKALFLDRDGVINIDRGYVHKIEDFDFIPEVFDICRTAQKQGYKIFVVTNQGGIARGYYTVETFENLTKWMEREFLKQDVKITKTYFSPFHEQGIILNFQSLHLIENLILECLSKLLMNLILICLSLF